MTSKFGILALFLFASSASVLAAPIDSVHVGRAEDTPIGLPDGPGDLTIAKRGRLTSTVSGRPSRLTMRSWDDIDTSDGLGHLTIEKRGRLTSTVSGRPSSLAMRDDIPGDLAIGKRGQLTSTVSGSKPAPARLAMRDDTRLVRSEGNGWQIDREV